MLMYLQARRRPEAAAVPQVHAPQHRLQHTSHDRVRRGALRTGDISKIIYHIRQAT